MRKQQYLGFRHHDRISGRRSWTTSAGGEYLSVGVRGAIAGRRADLVIIDDPIKSQADAESGRQRDHIWEWYKSDVTTRLKPGGKVVLIMTRWHPGRSGGPAAGAAARGMACRSSSGLAEARRSTWPAGWHAAVAGVGRPRCAHAQSASSSASAPGRRCSSKLRCRPAEGCFQSTVLPWRNPTLTVETTVRAWDLAATGETGRNDPDWTVGIKLSREQRRTIP